MVAATQPQGHPFDGAHIGRDVFALGPVASRGGRHQHTGAIGEGHRRAVDLELHGVATLVHGVADHPLDGLLEGLELALVEGVVERQHAHEMPMGLERRLHRRAHAQRR